MTFDIVVVELAPESLGYVITGQRDLFARAWIMIAPL